MNDFSNAAAPVVAVSIAAWGAPDGAKVAGKGVVCAGEHRRPAGFADKDMTGKIGFPSRLISMPRGDGWLRADEIAIDTLYGKGRLKRR